MRGREQHLHRARRAGVASVQGHMNGDGEWRMGMYHNDYFQVRRAGIHLAFTKVHHYTCLFLPEEAARD